MKMLLLIVVGLGLLGPAGSFAQEQKKAEIGVGGGFRTIAIPKRENGYDNFKTQIISSQEQLDAFLKDIESQDGWNERPAFLQALRDAKIDFAREVLALIRHREGSGVDSRDIPEPRVGER